MARKEHQAVREELDEDHRLDQEVGQFHPDHMGWALWEEAGGRRRREGGIPPIRAEVLSENENMGTGRQEQPTPMQPIYHFKGRENSKKK